MRSLPSTAQPASAIDLIHLRQDAGHCLHGEPRFTRARKARIASATAAMPPANGTWQLTRV